MAKFNLYILAFCVLSLIFLLVNKSGEVIKVDSIKYDSLNQEIIKLEKDLVAEKQKVCFYEQKIDSLNTIKTTIIKKYVIKYKQIDSIGPNDLCNEFNSVFSKHSIK